jgi:molybdopterin/thiamine biosynthesis adenylyltransferase
VSRRRWWQKRPDLLEREKNELIELGFSLEQERLDNAGEVVFSGELRRGSKRHPAQVVLPPAFLYGAQAHVLAPGLPIGRHIAPDGGLCLDHPVGGELAHLRGREAVQLAERLWQLWEEDRPSLEAHEARAPDPHSHYTAYYPGSAVTFADVDVGGGQCGILRVGLSSASPFRGAVTGLRVDEPDVGELPIAPANSPLAGPLQAVGVWRRLDGPPPGHTIEELAPWVDRAHGDLLESAQRIATIHRQVTKRAVTPAMLALVYPDELEWQVYGDQWLVMFIDHTDGRQLARPVTLNETEHFTRQPLLRPLSDKRVAIVGLGALGSTIASLLARAGVRGLVLVDIDYITPGNLVRHDLDLAHVGVDKVSAMRERLQRVNPYLETIGLRARYGHGTQAADDEVFEALASSDLIVNAAANPTGVHEHIAAAGREARRPVVHTWIGPGGWGARIIAQRETSGCPECLARHQADDPTAYPIQQGPTTEVLERGCTDPTFTAAGFDLAETASAASRAVTGVLLNDAERYPPPPDMLTLTLRTSHAAVPTATAADLPTHPECFVCNA